MEDFSNIGKSFIVIGAVLILIGVIVVFGPRIPLLGKLPGDIYIKRDGFIFYFPIVTTIVLSALISLFLYLFKK